MATIRPIKNGYNNPNLIYYDIETITIDGKMKFRLGVVTCEGFSFTCYDVKMFTNILLLLTEKRKYNYIVAHNANFDFSMLYHDYFDNFELVMFTTNPFIIHYQFKDMNRHNTNIVFIDSMSFFKNSLDELGKIFGREKITIDILRDKYDSEIAEYCKRDTEVLSDIMTFIDEQAKEYDIPFPLTFAQMSFLIYKRHFLRFNIPCPDLQNIMMLERESYFGGRVEVFDFNVYDAKSYDINSLYPFVMRNNYFPVKLISYYNNDNCYENQQSIIAMLEDKLDSNELVIARVRVKIPKSFICPIPFRNNGKLIFPYGEFEVCLPTPELQLIKNYILEVKEISVYAREKIFQNFIDTFYSERKKYPKGHPNNLFYKLVMNSLYGKFGQRRFEFTRYEQLDNIIKYGSTDLDIGNDELIRIEFFNGKAFRKDIYYDNPNTFVAIAAFVTSYARKELYKNLERNKDRVLYCDTDSMMLKDEPIDIELGEELGQWKLEQNYTDFKPLGNKHYSSKELLKIKGVPKDAERLSEYSFRFEKITKMKESIVRFKDPIPRVVIMQKNYSGEYDKRIVNEDKTTSPLNLSLVLDKSISPIEFLYQDEN